MLAEIVLDKVLCTSQKEFFDRSESCRRAGKSSSSGLADEMLLCACHTVLLQSHNIRPDLSDPSLANKNETKCMGE